MSSRLQLDVHNLSLGRRNLVNAYEVKADIAVIAGKTVSSMPERLECEVLQNEHYINTLTFTFVQLVPENKGNSTVLMICVKISSRFCVVL